MKKKKITAIITASVAFVLLTSVIVFTNLSNNGNIPSQSSKVNGSSNEAVKNSLPEDAEFKNKCLTNLGKAFSLEDSKSNNNGITNLSGNNSSADTTTEPNGSSDETDTVVADDQNGTMTGTPANDGGPSSASLALPTGSQLVAGWTGGSLAHYAIIQAKSGGSILSNGSIWICVAVVIVAAAAITTLVVIKKKEKNKSESSDSKENSEDSSK